MAIDVGYTNPRFNPTGYQPIGDNATVEEGFKPSYSPEDLRKLINLYQSNPTAISPENVDKMQKHAVHFNVPFYRGDFSIMEAMKQFGQGFLSGFTTLEMGEPPDNEYESIARNIGHLAGFAPGVAAGPLKMMRLPTLARTAAALNNRSVPMMGANWLTKKAKKIVRPALGAGATGKHDAFKTASNFLLGPKAKHMAEGAFHLGAASAISSWTHGVDAMMQSAFGGAVAGGAFRAMGNFINTGGKQSDKIVRGLAGSLFMGLPATMRGATTSEQVYEYLLGAYFGGKEMPWYKAKAFKGLEAIEKESQKNPELDVTKDPRLLEKWNTFEPEVQKELIKQAERIYGNADERSAAAHLLMDQLGILDKDTKLPTPQGFTELKEVVGGQELVRLTTPNKVLHHGISGAGAGSDAEWAKAGLDYNVPFVHYTFKGHGTKASAGRLRPLSDAELAEANVKIRKADESLNRLKGKKAKDFTNKLLQRNWWQVKTSNGVYVIGKIIKGGTEIEGGSGWATQMSIDAGKKHVYAWDTVSKKWHRYDYGLKKFRMLDKTPKLIKRFAGIGTRKLTGEGKKAIQEIYAVTFGKKKPRITKKAEAISEKDISVPTEEARKRAIELSEQADILTQELEAHMEAANDKTLSKSQRLISQKEGEKVAKQLAEIQEDISSQLKTLEKEATQESIETEDGNDIGMISNRPVEKKSVHFIDKHAKKLWDDKGYNQVIKLTKKGNYANILQEIINKSEYSGKNQRVDTEGIMQEFSDYLKQTEGIDYKPKEGALNELRQWLTLRNFGKQVRYLRVDDRGVSIAGIDKIYTRAGNKKLNNEPKKLLEEVYEEIGGKTSDKEPTIVVLDTITEKVGGKYEDMSLSRLRNLSENNEQYAGKYNYHMKRVFKNMLKKGYYPFGGKGDADAIIFTKLHPFVEGKFGPYAGPETREMQNKYALEFAIDKALTKSQKKELEKGFEFFARDNNYKLKNRVRDMFLSNIFYEIHLNGFRPDLDVDMTASYQNVLKKLLGKRTDVNDFIPNATALNKRNQIWFTPGWRSDPEFVKDYMEVRNGKKGFVDDLVVENNDLKYKYAIVRDVEKSLGRKLKLTDKNTDNETSVDGMIIVRDDVIDAINADAGQPVSGQNKSFIVSPDGTKGALLGKYMMHSAGKEATEAMQKKGLHFIMQESAVKQRGTREVGNYSISKDGKDMSIQGETYTMPTRDVRYNYSVKQDVHMLDPKRIPKQLLMAMGSNTFAPFSNDIITDMFNETVQKRYVGNPKYNKMVDNFMKNPQEKNLKEILDNIDEVGIENLLHAIKHGHTEFTELAYAKLMKFNREAMRDMVASGEMTQEQMNEHENSLVEFNTGTDRLIKEGSQWSKLEKAQGRSGDITPLFLHKYIRPLRVQVVRNYIMENISKPKIKNSALSRMRGYDKWMQQKFPELNNRDDIFFLDDAYKSLKLETHIKDYEQTTLGELWNAYLGKGKKKLTAEQKADAEEVFRAATVRVPMDSTSGAQVLKFKGFTDRKGHGIMMHARAMEAEGGADLDGDEAFVFFGGRKGGKGEGFKKAWKDAFEANKGEFYEGKGETEVAGFETAKGSKYQIHKDNTTTRDKAARPEHPGEKGIQPKSDVTMFVDSSVAAKLKARIGGLFNIKGPGGVKKVGFDAGSSKPLVVTMKDGKVYRFAASNKPSIGKHPLEFWKDAQGPHLGNKITKIGKVKMPGEGQSIYNNKNKEVRKLLTIQDSESTTGINPEVRDGKVWKYMPGWRVMISERARDGRNQLGSASNNVQLLKALHNALLVKGKDSFVLKEKKGAKKEDVEWEIIPKKDITNARKLASSMIAFSSDPLDEAGLKNHKIWFTELFKAYFNVKKNGKKIKITESQFEDLSYNGMYNHLREMNQAMFSRNWSSNRSFNMHEINTKTRYTEFADSFGNEAHRNTMLPKIANIARQIDYSDSVYKRTSIEALENIYTEHAKIIKKFPDLAKLLGRETLAVEQNSYIKNVKKYYLYNGAALDIVAKNYNSFIDAIRGTHFAHKLTTRDLKDNTYKNVRERKDILEKLRDMSEDFLVQDITDMTSLKLLSKYAETVDANKFKEIHRFVDKLKKDSYLMAKERRSIMDRYTELREEDPKHREFWDDLYKAHERIYGKEETKKVMPQGLSERPIEEVSALKDQMEIDAELKSFKSNLNPAEKKLTDMLLLNSFRRGRLQEIKKLDAEFGAKLRRDPLYEDLLHALKMKNAKTTMSKLGLSSNEVEGSSIREFFGEFSKIMKKSWEKPTELDAEVKDAGKPKEGTVYEPFIDKKIEGTEVSEIYSGFEGLGKADLSVLSAEQRQVITELAENLKFYNNKMGVELNQLTRGLFEKDLNAMNLADFKDMNNYFKEARSGTIWQRLFNEKTPDMRRRYWWQFPKTVGREMMKYDIMFLKSKGLFKKKGGQVLEGDIRRPTNVIEAAQRILGRMSEQGVQEGERLVGDLRKELVFLNGITDGESLRKLAVAEAEMSEVDRIFANREIPNELKGIEADNYRQNYKEALKESNYSVTKDKKYIITNTEGQRETLTGGQIVERVKKVYDSHFAEMYKTIEGEPGAMKKYIIGYYDKAKEEPIIDHKAFIKDVMKSFDRGEGIPLKYGLSPLRHISRSMMIEQAKALGNQKLLTKLLKFKIRPVGRIRNGYYPHLFFSKSKSLDALQRAHDYIKNLPENVMTKEEKLVQIQKLLTKSKTLTGDWMTGTENWEVFDKAVENIKNKEGTDPISAFDNANQMTGSMNTRMAHIGGWSLDASAAETYTRNQVNTYYKQFAQIMSRNLLGEFTKKATSKPHEWHKIKDYGDKTSLLTRWQNWLKLYISESMGSPSIIPDFILNDPKMKVKGTPYAWWADNKVKERANSIAKKLGLRGKNLLTVKHDLERVDYNDLRHWSNLEAKFELMSLLAHPKSAVANIFGGSLHTIQSTGLEYLRKARSISELQKINPKMKSLQDWDAFVVKHGVLPEFIVAELGMSREARKVNVQSFIKDISKKITKSGEMSKESIREIGRRYKVGENIVNKAAKFMSVPERALRRDAFMAHYIKAWERFGGAIKNPDHPFLIEMAKKGVQATQFLYNAPYRPAFARTALGKVMTRFQLWSWNAVRFRNDVNREAKLRGFRKGTAEYERFKRTMQTDLFVLALANVFAYSLFDSALPAPYNWLKDTSEWIFGDEKERNKAFFGTWPAAVAPLQIVTPPIMRLPVAGLRAFLDNDYEKLAQYHVYTMMPFGRMIRDVSPMAKGNLIENPSRLLEKSMGFPLGDLQAMARKIKKGDLYYPRSFDE